MVEFSEVTLGYPGRELLALDKVSFRTRPAEKVELSMWAAVTHHAYRA